MSILVVRVTPDGIIMGADRNITNRHTCPDHSTTLEYVSEKSQRPKVLRWPNRKALVGYAGEASIGGIWADEWLYDFIGRHLNFDNLDTLAHTLRSEIEQQRRIDEGRKNPALLLLHLTSFEERDSYQIPLVYFIRNAWKWDPTHQGYMDIRKEFQCDEHFLPNFPVPSAQIQEALSEHIKRHGIPFGFQQGLALPKFNAHDLSLAIVNKLLSQIDDDYKIEPALQDWENRVKMAILTYGAYYEAFYRPGWQFVGGGADTVSLHWPRN